jgi:hypothetical protein
MYYFLSRDNMASVFLPTYDWLKFMTYVSGLACKYFILSSDNITFFHTLRSGYDSGMWHIRLTCMYFSFEYANNYITE